MTALMVGKILRKKHRGVTQGALFDKYFTNHCKVEDILAFKWRDDYR